MNPYEATLPNVMARVRAWVRGLLRLYRKPLLLIGAATATLAIGVSATQAPAMPPAAIVTASR